MNKRKKTHREREKIVCQVTKFLTKFPQKLKVFPVVQQVNVTEHTFVLLVVALAPPAACVTELTGVLLAFGGLCCKSLGFPDVFPTE